MGEVNNIVCDYLGLPGYYADFWNGTVFRGKRKIRIWQLSRHDREAMKEYYLEHKERFRELDEISIDTMGVLIGKKSLKLFPQEGGGLDLCKAFEDEREEGRMEGRAEGKAEGERIGREMGAFAMLCGLVKDGLLKLEDAAKRMNMSEEMFFKRMQEL